MKNDKYWVLLPILLIAFQAIAVFAQQPERSVFEDTGPLPWFFVNGSSFVAADSISTNLTISTRIAYDRLAFIKKDT